MSKVQSEERGFRISFFYQINKEKSPMHVTSFIKILFPFQNWSVSCVTDRFSAEYH